MAFSKKTRQEAITKVQNEEMDLLIIGDALFSSPHFDTRLVRCNNDCGCSAGNTVGFPLPKDCQLHHIDDVFWCFGKIN